MSNSNKSPYILLVLSQFFSIVLAANTIPIPASASPSLNLFPQPAQYNFGQINQGAATPIKHNFILKNNNAAPVTVVRIAVSCGCTTAVAGGGVTLPDVLAPGKEIEVDTSIDPLRLFAGPVEKSVSVYIRGQSPPAAVLEITGISVPAASFSPDLLNFGDVAYGDGASVSLTATIDRGMVPSLDVIKFETTDSDITAEKVSTAPFGANEETVVYKVKLSQTPFIGLINGTVSLMIPNGVTGLSVIGSSVPIQGNVVGGVGAAPESVTFADVPAGQETTQHVLITGIAASDIPKVGLFTASPLIELRFEPADPAAKALKLDIVLSSKMNVGSLQTQAIITAPDGEKIMLPILVFTVPGGASVVL
jgi:hypothetical protein